MTPEQYDETSRRLEKVGDWPPKGLEYHVAFVSDGKFRVSEIWDSREQFDAFGKLLMPVLSDVGIELSGDPEILKIHNVSQALDAQRVSPLVLPQRREGLQDGSGALWRAEILESDLRAIA